MSVATHDVVPHEAWLEARTALLAKEKEFTRMRDSLSAQRRALPWEVVEKDYVFDSPAGTETLADLFDGCSQLIVYHFMYPADWDEGCRHCSLLGRQLRPGHRPPQGARRHHGRGVTGAARQADHLQAADGLGLSLGLVGGQRLQRRLRRLVHPRGGRARAFYNYRVQPTPSEREGMSVFLTNDDGRIFHTYSAYARGIDLLNTAYNYLDTVPKGRDEDGRPQHWVRRHDEYDA